MDLINQDPQVRERLQEAYTHEKFRINGRNSHSVLQQALKYCAEGRKHPIDEPDRKATNLIRPDDIKFSKHLSNPAKWPINFLQQLSVLLSRHWTLARREQFSKLVFMQTLFLAVIFGLFCLRLKFDEHSLPDRESFMFYL